MCTDPRVTGRSTPATCDLTGADADPRNFLPWPGPNGDISGNVAQAKRIAQDCVRNGGDLMRSISTHTEAMDIDRIRQALGEPTTGHPGAAADPVPEPDRRAVRDRLQRRALAQVG